MKRLLILAAFLLCALYAAPAHAQGGNTVTIRFPGAPTGTCNFYMYGINNATGDLYDCKAGVWFKIGPSSSSGVCTPGGVANSILIDSGSGCSDLGSLGTTTTVLHGNAAGAPTFAKVVSADLNLTTTTCTNQFLTALSAAAAGTCTPATLASAQFANQGTTTTLLHGNAAGNPTWAAVDLATAQVTGQLPIGNVGSAGLSGTAPIAISAAGAISCTTCVTTSSGTVPFTNIAAGTNSSAAMVLGTGSSLTVSGSGTNNATTLNGATFAAPGAIGSGTPSSGAFTSVTATGGTISGQDLTTTQTFALGASNGGGIMRETRTVSTALTTTANLLVSMASTGNVGTTATSATNASGIAVTSQTAAQDVVVSTYGFVPCVADNAVTAGNLIGVGTSTAGRCKDLGQTSSLLVSNQLQIIGQAFNSAAGAGSIFTVKLFGQGVFGTLPGGTTTTTISSGTSALATSAISSGACATVVTTAATGTATTDDIIADFNADPTSTTGYSASANGMLTIIKYPTSNNVNFKICNNTASSITPGAVTLNWRVVR